MGDHEAGLRGGCVYIKKRTYTAYSKYNTNSYRSQGSNQSFFSLPLLLTNVPACAIMRYDITLSVSTFRHTNDSNVSVNINFIKVFSKV